MNPGRRHKFTYEEDMLIYWFHLPRQTLFNRDTDICGLIGIDMDTLSRRWAYLCSVGGPDGAGRSYSDNFSAWTPIQEQFVIDNYHSMSGSQIGKALGFTRQQVYGKANHLRLRGLIEEIKKMEVPVGTIRGNRIKTENGWKWIKIPKELRTRAPRGEGKPKKPSKPRVPKEKKQKIVKPKKQKEVKKKEPKLTTRFRLPEEKPIVIKFSAEGKRLVQIKKGLWVYRNV